MSLPIPFQVGRGISQAVSGAYNESKDKVTIEDILNRANEATQTQDIESLLSEVVGKVSQERQQGPMAALQMKYQNFEAQKQKNQQKQQLRSLGLPEELAGTDPRILQQLLKDKSADDRFKNIVSNQNPGLPNFMNQPSAQNQGMSQAPVPQGTSQMAPKTGIASLSDDQLVALSGIPGYAESAKQQLKRNQEERSLEQKKMSEERADARELRKETLPLRKEISDRAQVARRGIESKNELINLINTGKIDDPSFATIMEAIPLNLGKRFLSPETVEYKGGLVQGYGDLRNIFTGATRVKEIDILESKIADIYLTDEQKKSILKSSLATQQKDLILEEVAAEIESEGKNYGVLQYSREVEKRAKPKLNALFNRILDENKYIIQDAENRKKIPLEYDDPEGRQILDQIMKEAGGNRQKAREIAKKKGYIIGK